MVLEFPILADYCILYECGHMIFATHGHNFNKEKMPPLHGRYFAARPYPYSGTSRGAAASRRHDLPEPSRGQYTRRCPFQKQNSAHSYMTLKDGVFQWKTLEGESYHQWEIFE